MVSNDRNMKHVLTRLIEFVTVDGIRLSFLNKRTVRVTVGAGRVWLNEIRNSNGIIL